jgi:lipopolysaccharide biosynthesis regulator YciM
MHTSNGIIPILEGISHIIDGNTNKAISVFKDYTLKGDHSPENYIILGKLYRQQKEYIRAIKIHESINSIVNLDNNVKYYNLQELIYSYYGYGDYEKALYYANGIKHKNDAIFKIMADSYLQLKLYEKAAKIYKKLEKQKDTLFLRHVAYCYFLEEEDLFPTPSSKALSIIKKGLKHYDKSRRGNMLLIDYYYQKKENNNCINSIEKFIDERLAKCDSDLNILEKIYFDIDNIENFAAKILKAFKSDEKNVFFALYLSDYYERMNKIEKASDILKKNIQLNGLRRIVIKKYLTLKNDETLKLIIDEQNYKCLKCESIYSAYSDICNSCKSIETLKPY